VLSDRISKTQIDLHKITLLTDSDSAWTLVIGGARFAVSQDPNRESAPQRRLDLSKAGTIIRGLKCGPRVPSDLDRSVMKI